MYLYCQNPRCGVYLSAHGGDKCVLCGWNAGRSTEHKKQKGCMKRGYYLWDWYGTKTIKFDPDIEFHSEQYAEDQDCYRRFAVAKQAGISALSAEILYLNDRLNELEKLTVKDIKP